MEDALKELNKSMNVDHNQQETYDRSKLAWTQTTETISIGYACSYGKNNGKDDIQFSVSWDCKQNHWIWEVYRIDVDRIVRCGFENLRKSAEQIAFNMAITECQYARKENKYKEKDENKRLAKKLKKAIL